MSVQMSDVRKTPSRMQQIIELLFSIFLRLLAIVFFAAAIYIWMTAIGYWEGANYRFDTMGVALKIYTAIMAVMLPVAWATTPMPGSMRRLSWFRTRQLKVASVGNPGVPMRVMFPASTVKYSITGRGAS